MANIDLAGQIKGKTTVVPNLSRYFFLAGEVHGSTTIEVTSGILTIVPLTDIPIWTEGRTYISPGLGMLASLEAIYTHGQTDIRADMGYASGLAATVAGSTTVTGAFTANLRAFSDIPSRTTVSASLRLISAYRTGLSAGTGITGLSSTTPTMVTISAGVIGVSTSVARADHAHQLDQSIAPTWTGIHRFNENISHVRGVPYTWPSAQGAADTFLRNDGSGVLTWVAGGGGGSFDTTANYTVTGKWVFSRTAGSTLGLNSVAAISVTGNGSTILNDYWQIVFPYSPATNTNAPAAIGYKITDTDGSTKGSLVFATRDTTADSAPTVRMTIGANGTTTLTGNTVGPYFGADNGAVNGTPRGYWIKNNSGIAAPVVRYDTSDYIVLGGGNSPDYDVGFKVHAAGTEVFQMTLSGIVMTYATASFYVRNSGRFYMRNTVDDAWLPLGFLSTGSGSNDTVNIGGTGSSSTYNTGLKFWSNGGLAFSYSYPNLTLDSGGRIITTQLTVNGVAYTWPSATAASNGQVLSSTTGGTLSWATVATSGHTHDADYVNVTGDTMTGNLVLAATRPTIRLNHSSDTQSVRLADYVGSAAYLTYGISYDGTDWQRDDTSAASAIYSFSGANPMTIYTVPSGTNPATSALVNVAVLNAAGLLHLPVTGSSAGLQIGGDVNLYRSAADVLRTPDSLTVDGALTVDTTTLAVDAANDRVGINTASPSVRLHVRRTASGVTAPAWDLTTDAVLIENSSGVAIQFFTPNTAGQYVAFSDPEARFRGYFGYEHSTDTLNIGAGGVTGLTVTATSQVQIPITGSSAGLLIGGDVQLYRSAANALTVTDKLGIGITPSATLHAYAATAAFTGMVFENDNASGTVYMQLRRNTSGSGRGYMAYVPNDNSLTFAPADSYGVAGGATMVLTRDGALGIQDGITAPSTLTGWAYIYVDSADGDLKVKFGDGTVKTIVTDT